LEDSPHDALELQLSKGTTIEIRRLMPGALACHQLSLDSCEQGLDGIHSLSCSI